MNHNYLRNPFDPSPGDYVILTGADGQPSGKYSKIQRLISADYDEEMFEVYDTFGRHLIVMEAADSLQDPSSERCTWAVVEHLDD